MKAFPTVNWVQQQGQAPNDEGMDLRDYFAAKAMQAFIHSFSSKSTDKVDTIIVPNNIPQYAYEFADLMMKARASGIGE